MDISDVHIYMLSDDSSGSYNIGLMDIGVVKGVSLHCNGFMNKPCSIGEGKLWLSFFLLIHTIKTYGTAQMQLDTHTRVAG